jgi:phospholipid transport system substrate-binding protein
MVKLFAALFAAFALTLTGPAFAGAATDLVKGKQTTLFDLLKQGTPESQKKIDGIFDEMLDYSSLAESSLGPEWAARSDKEKAEFVDLLKQLVRNAYTKNLKKIIGFEVDYLGEESAEGAMLVKTRSKPKDPRDEPVEINFKVVQKDGNKWKVHDIITEGVSLVHSYRGQFTKIIKKDGFPALLQKMKDKLAKGDTG